ncbi:DUF4254 domain-containing protein [Nocardia concava]|uniref:DUF4254 domain-containing protein n=1 Tax=Nocardia concava TaxID=257281 RepID=UPI000307AE06|nr:DUF4254 domain-containing protein [Nocardia concava]
MTAQLPSKDMVLEACTGCIIEPHPVLQAAYELASLHEARPGSGAVVREIDCARYRLVREIDRWVAREMPVPHAAAALHTESVGMVIDRLAGFSVEAHAALSGAGSEFLLHFAWQRLAELSLAYDDLAEDLAAQTRRIPDFSCPAPESGQGGEER